MRLLPPSTTKLYLCPSLQNSRTEELHGSISLCSMWSTESERLWLTKSAAVFLLVWPLPTKSPAPPELATLALFTLADRRLLQFHQFLTLWSALDL
ncbi:hypothetical protein Csa_000873 [Cucumis sativus]|uniref:Uncharacterized protein n=1 Tax=Cucumis sativus TaxID=3659 RepID=A0A0A0LFJ1_CUCSA|nr:hypothetical protein Csa_000873 [Cucumis sativus]